MTDLLKEIIEVDKAARERVEAAKNEKAEAYAAIASRKDALINEEKQKARKKAEAIGAQRRADGEKQLETIREKNKVIAAQMDKLYAEKKEQWIDEIVSRVLSRSEV